MSRETKGIGRGPRVVTWWRAMGAVTVASTGSLCTHHPFDRFPQWMQRRKMEPDEQVTPKS